MNIDAKDLKEYCDFEPSAEGLHKPGPEPQWNESKLFLVVESGGERGTMLRIGRRVNEGYAEVTVLHLFSNSAVAVGFQRVPISDNLALRAGGLEFSVLEPFKKWRCAFTGPLRLVSNGMDLINPKLALAAAPILDCKLDLLFEDITPPFGAMPGGNYPGNTGLSLRRYEALGRISGAITLNGERRVTEGLGFRDHGWGMRDWHAIDHWRWIFGQFDHENVFSVVVFKVRGISPHVYGFVRRNGKMHVVKEMKLACRYTSAPPYYLEEADICIPLPDGNLRAIVKPRGRLLLRHVKGDLMLRLVEHLVTVEMDSRQGTGWLEVADKVVEGIPIGNAFDQASVPGAA